MQEHFIALARSRMQTVGYNVNLIIAYDVLQRLRIQATTCYHVLHVLNDHLVTNVAACSLGAACTLY